MEVGLGESLAARMAVEKQEALDSGPGCPEGSPDWRIPQRAWVVTHCNAPPWGVTCHPHNPGIKAQTS